LRLRCGGLLSLRRGLSRCGLGLCGLSRCGWRTRLLTLRCWCSRRLLTLCRLRRILCHCNYGKPKHNRDQNLFHQYGSLDCWE
jgi:hypothetical protein